MHQSTSPRWLALLGLLGVLAACASPAPTPTVTPKPTPSTISAQDVTPILATTQLRTGTQRVAFILESSTRLITTPTVTIATMYNGAPTDMAEAPFRKWPYGTRGSYAAQLTFDQPGAWIIRITSDGIVGKVELPVVVTETSIVADIGQVAPFSNTKTLEKANGDLSTITSYNPPDPDLYRMSVVDALISGKPSVIVFASPAFCTSPTCGPEVDTVDELKNAYKDQANFIHVEVYDNPSEIQGDLTRGRLSPVLDEWGIDKVPDYHNESWTFVLGRDGHITQRFEGYATYDEIEAALVAALR